MPRIRSLHAEQWTDDSFVTCSPLARLLALGVRNWADDNGIFEWNPIKLKMRILPADSCDVAGLLEELEETNQVHHYEAGGREYGLIRSFDRYQRPKKPSYTHPVPTTLQAGYALRDPAPKFGTGGEPEGNQTGKPGAEVGSRGREGEEQQEQMASTPRSPSVLCPYEKLVAAYHQVLPSNPRCLVLSDSRRRAIRARWAFWMQQGQYQTVEEGLAWWVRFFGWAGKSLFLTGATPPQAGRATPFIADIDFLMRPDKNVHVFEGRYHEEVEA